MTNINIIATVDVTKCKTVKELHTQLVAIKKDVYEDYERIVIITSSKLPDTLELVNDLLNVIDIPTFFIIYKTVDYCNTDSLNFKFSKTHCIYPWTNIEIKNDGTLSPCCKAPRGILDNNGIPMNIKTSTIKEAYLSDFMVNLRNDLRVGSKPTACNDCWTNEAAELDSSLRFRANYKFREIYYTIDYTKHDFNNLRSLDLKLGNTCNLSCRICSPYPSSKIATMELNAGRLSKIDFNIIKQQSKWSDSDNFWMQFLPIANNLVELDILGGEPLLVKSHFNFLKKLIELDVAKNIKLDYASNGTVYSKEYIELWKHFKETKISFSIDDIENRFEYQRNGANWEQVNENIRKYSELRSDNFIIELYPTINIQNVYYLPELLEWAKKIAFDSISYSFVHIPDQLSICNLTDSAKDLTINKLLPWADQHLMIKSSINMILQSATNIDNSKFINYMQQLDTERGQNFTNHHTDIAKAMGYR